MGEWYAIAPQEVALGANIIFTDGTGCITHRDDSGIFTLHGGHKYKIMFNGNVTGATADVGVAFAIAVAGEPLEASRMLSTPSAANELNNVASAVIVKVPPCCCYTVSVENVGTTAATVQNANILIEEVK